MESMTGPVAWGIAFTEDGRPPAGGRIVAWSGESWSSQEEALEANDRGGWTGYVAPLPEELASLRREVQLLRAVAEAAAPLRLGRDMRGVALTWGSPVQRRIEAALRAVQASSGKG